MTVSPPLALLGALTRCCPMRCVYCSNPLAREPVSSELSTPVWYRVLNEAAQPGVPQVHFRGSTRCHGREPATQDLR
jgi:PqqA peptide cyclase